MSVRRYLSRRSTGSVGGIAPSPLLSTAQRAAALLLSPLVEGLAGVLSLAGLLYDPAEEQRLQQAQEEEQEERRAVLEAAAAAPEAALQQEAREALQQEAREVLEQRRVQRREVPAGRSHEEAVQAAAAADMSEVDMRAHRSAALRARQPKVLKSPEELQPRHTARPELTAAANAVYAPPPPPVAMPPPVPEAASGEDFDANVAFSLQVGRVGGWWVLRVAALGL